MRYTVLFPCSILFSLLLISACKDDDNSTSTTPEQHAISLNTVSSWAFASVPCEFPESGLNSDLASGYNRAKFCWYMIDASVFYDQGSTTRPVNITHNDMSRDDCRVIYSQELFPEINYPENQPMNIPVLNMDYYPAESGPWNFNAEETTYAAGIQPDGRLKMPQSRWGGMIRPVSKTDFPLNYLEFWLLDPFTTYPDADGHLVINLGDISEDLLKDGKLSAENYSPENPQITPWGKVYPLTPGFNFTDLSTDIGIDEINDQDETTHFNDYLEKIHSICNSEVYSKTLEDPAGDNYHHYTGADYDALNYKVCDRYRNYRSDQGNSNTSTQAIASRAPNSEDINRNGILDTLNSYTEYRIRISRDAFVVNSDYIVEKYEYKGSSIIKENGSPANGTFYHFSIPLSDFTASYGQPAVDGHPNFIRIYLTGFYAPVNLRFVTLSLNESPAALKTVK